jgi:hypothetical protein
MPTIKELESGVIIRENKIETTTFNWNGKNYPLPIAYSLGKLCTSLLKLNTNARFLPILVSGKSESGKSTLVRSIIHRTCCEQPEDKKRIIQWFVGKDMFKMKDIIKQLPKNKKYALVLDDQSFVLDQAKPNLKKELMEYFTVMRKDLGDEDKVQCFFFTNMHYSRAMPPMLRDSYVRILTSMTDEDSQNWKDLFGWENQYKIKIFQKQFSSQMQNGWFYVKYGNMKPSQYYTNAPFRIAFVKDLEGVHPLLFAKEGCDLCAPPKHHEKDITYLRKKQNQELKELGLTKKYDASLFVDNIAQT